MLLFHASLFDLATWLILSLFLLFKFRFSESLEPQLNIHRIIESLGLEETLQIILFQPLPWKFWSMNCNIRYATDLNNTLLHFQPHRVLVSTPVTNIRHRKKNYSYDGKLVYDILFITNPRIKCWVLCSTLLMEFLQMLISTIWECNIQ